MGFEINKIVSSEHHYGQYECSICQSLVDLDCVVTTRCSHVFCRSCLLPWIERTDSTNSSAPKDSIPKCPTCNQNLLFAGSSSSASMMVGSRCVLVQPLEVCQPLAHRVLRRIQVACPLQHTPACTWKGDYGDLQNHLLSPSAHASSEVNQDFSPSLQPRHSTIIQDKGFMNDVGSNETRRATPLSSEHDITLQSAQDADSSLVYRVVAIASSFKEQANEKFATQHIDQALALYSKALSVLTENGMLDNSTHEALVKLRVALYSNRAACHHRLGAFEAAIEDATRATALDPTFSKAFLRKARAQVQIADLAGALSTLSDGVAKAESNNASSLLQKDLHKVQSMAEQHQKSQDLLERKEFAAAKAELGKLLRETTAPLILLEAAEADLGMGLVDSAKRLCLQALRRTRSAQDPKALLIQGQCNILSINNEKDDNQVLDSGISLLKHAMRLDPDNQKVASTVKQWLKVLSALKIARQAAFQRKFEDSFQHYSDCMKMCPLLPNKAPLYSALFTERAQVSLRLKKYDAALQDVALVVYHREDYVAAWLVRFAALHGKGKHDVVLEEVEDLLRTWGQNEPRIRQAYDKADFELRKARRPDFYKMLGVPSIASEREIKKAYRTVAKDMHPDRFASASEEERQNAQRNFQTLSEGLEILSDDFQRKLYDEGYDVEAIKERVQAAEQAAHRSNYRGGQHGFHGH